MSDRPSVLHVRVRDAPPGEKLSNRASHQIIEVWDGDLLVGQLPCNDVDYVMHANRQSILTLTFLGGGATMESKP